MTTVLIAQPAGASRDPAGRREAQLAVCEVIDRVRRQRRLSGTMPNDWFQAD